MPEEAKKETPRIIGSNIGLSVTVVIAIVVGITANLKMISDMGERYARLDVTLIGVKDDLGEIKAAMKEFTSAMQTDIRDLRDRLSRLEAKSGLK